MDEPLIGRTFGHYEITEKIGEGGMGAVYKARDIRLDRSVALKMLPGEWVANPERKRRFALEARAASALNHPNIITIYDIDVADGVDFIAMEYVAGQTLADMIPPGGMEPARAIQFGAQIADALATAHQSGIVHRDLKPSNIMVNDQGRVKVLDFGLAKLIEPVSGEGAATRTVQTREGMILGTVSYMAPEQAEGEQCGPEADVYALGLTLYEAWAGENPVAGANAAQHSELPSALFLQAGGLRVVFPSTPHQAFWLMRAAIRSDDPVVVLHHPALGSIRGTVEPEAVSLGDAVVTPIGTGVSLIASGLMAHRARAVAQALVGEGLSIEVVDVCSLNPMPWETILASVEKTGRAVVVDEGRLTCSVASEIAAGIGERAFQMLRAPVRRLAVPDVPIPFAPGLEAAVIPSEEEIAAATREIARA